jgi:cytochrome b561
MKGNDTRYRSHPRYGAVTQILHWATAVLVVVAFIYGLGGSEQRVYAPSRDFDRQLHETLGLCVLALVAVRIIWRRIDEPPNPPQLSRWTAAMAKVVSGVLYLLLVGVPLTAIFGAWLEGHPVTLLAGVEIPPILTISHDAGVTIASIHTWLGDAILWVAGFHALAGLYHHFFLKDDVLASMLPAWFPLRKPKGD